MNLYKLCLCQGLAFLGLLSFTVLYDTDDRLSVSVYAEGGASTLPHGWCGTNVYPPSQFVCPIIQPQSSKLQIITEKHSSSQPPPAATHQRAVV